MEADGYGFGSGYRQHHWGKGGKGFGNHGYPNMVWPIAWEGHAGKRLMMNCFSTLYQFNRVVHSYQATWKFSLWISYEKQ